jgi:hypothetical protein
MESAARLRHKLVKSLRIVSSSSIWSDRRSTLSQNTFFTPTLKLNHTSILPFEKGINPGILLLGG